MARYNRKTPGTRTVNLAGGEAFKVTPELEFAALCLTTFLKDQFYRDAAQTHRQMLGLMERIRDKKFIAQTGIFARNEFGMRSVTHVIAGELPNLVKNEGWVKHAINKIVKRTDDITEIMAYWFHKNGTHKGAGVPVPNSLKRGLSMSFDKFDGYQLAKYRAAGKEVSLVDVVNLVRPRPTEKNADALQALVTDDLRSASTWEAKISAAGQGTKDVVEVAKRKAEAWESLVLSGKIGYFALLRNLRNIAEQADKKVLDAALGLLVDPKRIKGSLVLPFRYLTAYYTLMEAGVPAKVLGAVSDAVNIALGNVPKFEGDTLVIVDRSGSMGGGVQRLDGRGYWAGRGNSVGSDPWDIAAMFAAALARTNEADVLLFSSDGQYVSINPRSDVFGIIESLERYRDGSGTDFRRMINKINKPYDRIVILSDEQGWVDYKAPTKELAAYKAKYNCNPAIYSFDLQGYGTLMFPERSVYTLAGWSDKVFDIMKMFGEDPNALINTIKRVQL